MGKQSADGNVVFHAGFPNASEDGNFGVLSLDALVTQHPASTFFWRLATEIPSRLWPAGSILVVDRSLTPREDDIVVVASEGDLIVCQFHSQRFIRLNGQILGESQLWGVITHCLQSLRGIA